MIKNGRPHPPLPNFKESKIRERNFIRNEKDEAHRNVRFLSFAVNDRVVPPNFLSCFLCIFASITTLDNGLSVKESRAVKEGHEYPSA